MSRLSSTTNKEEVNALETNNIKQWYVEVYPDDEKGKELNPLVTFTDAWYVLNDVKAHQLGIYTLLGVISPTIKKRIFTEMVERKYCHSVSYLETLFLFGVQTEV